MENDDSEMEKVNSSESQAITCKLHSASANLYTREEVDAAVRVFEKLIKWRNEAREKGFID